MGGVGRDRPDRRDLARCGVGILPGTVEHSSAYAAGKDKDRGEITSRHPLYRALIYI